MAWLDPLGLTQARPSFRGLPKVRAGRHLTAPSVDQSVPFGPLIRQARRPVPHLRRTNRAASLLIVPVGNPSGQAIISFGFTLSGQGYQFVPAAAPPAGSVPHYEVRIVDKVGTVYGILDVDDSTYFELALNGPGQAQFQAPTTDSAWVNLLRTVPSTGELQMLDRELQVWRNGTLIWWGKPTRPEAQGRVTRIQAQTLEWYFHHLNYGPIQRNWLANPDFEMGSLAAWTASGPTATVATGNVVKGTYAAQLNSATSGQDSFLYQRQTVTTFTIPVIYTVAGWVYLKSDYANPALDERGLFLQNNGVGSPVFGTDWNFTKISNSTGTGHWVRLVTSITVPANTTTTLETRLYSPQGTVLWDDISLSVPESVASDLAGNDIAQLIQRIIAYSQDPARGMASLNLAFALTGSGSTGVTQVWSAQSDQHGSIADSFNQWAAEDDCDWAIIPSQDGRARTFTVYPGRRGSKQPASPVLLNGNVAEDQFRWAYDGEQAAARVRVLGVGGGGSDQEVGVYIDTTYTGGTSIPDLATTHGSQAVTSASGAFTSSMVGLGIYSPSLPLSSTVVAVADANHATVSWPALVDGTNVASVGGLILDSVQSAPMETPVGGLAARAKTESKRMRSPILTAQVMVKDQGRFIGVVNPGDQVPCTISYGWIVVNTYLRVMAMRVIPKSESVWLTLALPAT